MENYTSMASHWNEIVDCRMLQLEFGCYQLSFCDVKNIAEYCYIKTVELLDQIFFPYWDWDGKYINPDTINSKILQASNYIDWGVEADVIGNEVYNKKTFLQYEKKLSCDTSATAKTMCISKDYFDYFQKYFSVADTAQKCKSAILKIFNEDTRKKMALWRAHDFAGNFSTIEYSNFTNLYRVEFSLKIALTCLANHACDYAQKMADILIGVSDLTSNISGHVNISPIHWPASSSGHLQYFGGNIGENDSKFQHRKEGYYDVEWNPYYYLRGAEWFNVISPLQINHLQDIYKNQQTDTEIAYKRLSSGGMAVFFDKDITDVDVSDLKNIKRILYNALYPGYGQIMLSHLFDYTELSHFCKPRPQWEYVPIFDDEIEITDDKVIFKHKNCCIT